MSPDRNYLGAVPIDHYRKILDEILLNGDKACAFNNGRPQEANNGDEADVPYIKYCTPLT